MQESRLSSWKENLERLILSLKGKDEDSAENIALSGEKVGNVGVSAVVFLFQTFQSGGS